MTLFLTPFCSLFLRCTTTKAITLTGICRTEPPLSRVILLDPSFSQIWFLFVAMWVFPLWRHDAGNHSSSSRHHQSLHDLHSPPFSSKFLILLDIIKIFMIYSSYTYTYPIFQKISCNLSLLKFSHCICAFILHLSLNLHEASLIQVSSQLHLSFFFCWHLN